MAFRKSLHLLKHLFQGIKIVMHEMHKAVDYDTLKVMIGCRYPAEKPIEHFRAGQDIF